MDGEASNEDRHEDDESNTHEQHGPPELRHPLGYREQRFLVEEQILQPGQGPLSVDLSALEEDVAVSLEVVARRAGPQTKAFVADTLNETG